MATRIAPKSRVKCVDTQKLFFGRFAYSFTIPFPTEELRALKQHQAKFRYNDALQSEIRMKRGLLNRVYRFKDAPDDLEYRIFATAVVFYTNDGDAFERLVKRHAKIMSKASRPQVHPDVLAEIGIDTVVRDSLWFGKYQVKIIMNMMTDTSELDELVQEQFGEEPEVAYYNYGKQRILYVRDTKKLIIAKLKLHSFISRVEKIKLLEEITDERATTAQAN